MNSAPCFEAEHLLSLEISTGSEKSVTRPEEAIIRLHQLDFSKCLTSTRVILRLEPSELSIVDQKAGYTIERIPFSSITPCQEVFVKSVNDKHPNLAIITVGDSFDIVPAEFYIFQFANTSMIAKDFIQKINEYKESREKNQQINRSNKLDAVEKPEKSDATRMMEDQAQRTAFATQRYKRPVDYPNIISSTIFFPSSGSGPQTPNEENQMMDKYLNLLNKSLDDVEKFISRLQQAAVAYQELEEKRHQSRRMPANEENMLIMQARPPPPKDYFDIFQKIKFTFNLLAKLKGSIRNPTAAEMVHYIFHPLDLIVEASCAILGPDEQPLWEHVLNPLLIPEAVNFLEDCLLTKEVELWRSLGSAWNISSSERDFWLSCIQEIPMYVPVFYDGYSPPPSILAEVCPKLDPRPQAPTTFNKPARESRFLLDAHSPQQRMDTSPFRPNELQHQGLVSRRSNSPQMFRSSSGSSPRWSPTYPVQQLHPPLPPLSQASPITESSDLQKEFVNGLLAKGAKVFIVTSDRIAENNMELSVTTGQVLEVLETNRFNSKVRNLSGIIGYVPSSIITPYVTGNGSLEADPKNRHSYISEGEKGQKSAIDNLNEEFQSKIRSNDAEPTKKKHVTKPSSGVITDKSTPEEVTNWLAQKGFSEAVQSSLASFGGKQLFVMDKTVLEKLFGFDVGSRLYSQILVQRNLCGYKTMRAKELQSILEQRKKKADSIIGDVFKANDRKQTTSQLFSANLPSLVSEQL